MQTPVSRFNHLPHPEEPRAVRRLEGWAAGKVLAPILLGVSRACARKRLDGAARLLSDEVIAVPGKRVNYP